MNNINSEVLKNAAKAGKFWAGENEENSPYTPANGSEGDWFESNWCRKCANNDSCDIVICAYCGEEPKEWVYVQ